MSNREIAIDLIQKLPDTVSLHDIAREIEFVAGVREGFLQMERGEGVAAEELDLPKLREQLATQSPKPFTPQEAREAFAPDPHWDPVTATMARLPISRIEE